MSSQWQPTGEGPRYVCYTSVSSTARVAWVGSSHSVLVPTEVQLGLVGLLWPHHCLWSPPCVVSSGLPVLSLITCPLLSRHLVLLCCLILAQALRARVLPQVPLFSAGSDFVPSIEDTGNVCRYFWLSHWGGGHGLPGIVGSGREFC